MKRILSMMSAAMLLSYGVFAQDPIVNEDFEGYDAGVKLAQTAGGNWTTWSEAPGGAEDPLISDAQASSGTKSFVIEAGNDCVLKLNGITSGRVDLRCKVYVPAGFLGYFNVIQDFAGSNSKWGTQIYFDENGAGKADVGSSDPATFTYENDKWYEYRTIVDLDADQAELYFNGEMLGVWKWSTGAFGQNDVLKLDAMNFYAWDGSDNSKGTPKFYIDDVVIKNIEAPVAPTNFAAAVADRNVTLTWTAPADMTPDKYVVYRDGAKIGETTTELTYADNDVYPGDHSYGLVAVYNELGSTSMLEAAAVIEGGVDRTAVVIEIGTGTWCQYCPGAAMGVDELYEQGKKVGVIEYHGGDSYENEEAGARLSFYGIESYPTAQFDGVTSVGGGSHTESNFDKYLPVYDAKMAVPSLYNLSMVVDYAKAQEFTVDVTAEKVEEYAANDVKMFVALTQSNIQESWQGQSELNFVFLKMFPNADGESISFAGGNTQDASFTVTLPNDFVGADYQLVVFMQDMSTKQILQTIVKDFAWTGVQELVDGEIISVYPNPAADVLNIKADNTIKQVRMMNYAGQVVYSAQVNAVSAAVSVSEFAKGIYVAEIETAQGVSVQKVVVK